MKLLEDRAKTWLRDCGLDVPDGRPASSPAEAVEAARAMGGRVAVKALVAAGRRGKAGGVRLAQSPEAAGEAAHSILGTDIAGQRCARVYVERAVDIAAELYASFGFGSLGPQIVVSTLGGVEIETTAERDPAAIVPADVDPLRGLRPWEAAGLWDRAGAASKLIPQLAALTVRLYEAFRRGDALLLEANPIAVTPDGSLCVIGAMMEVDDNALFRHAEWQDLGLEDAGPGGRPLNERERAVIAADRRYSGGAIRYTELDGNIGLCVAGGGAGLLQHDLLVAAGGRAANHSDFSPAGVDKPAALFDAIFANPRAKGMLVGVNYLQLLPCTLIVEALLLSLRRNRIDPRRFPIVLRLFGPREDEARSLAASVPGLHYLPPDASLAKGVEEIVAAVRRIEP